jgi:DNA-binding NtrC family response regulator
MPDWFQAGTLPELVRDLERKVILARLKYYGTALAGKRSIARELGISVATLYNKMKNLGITDGNSNKLEKRTNRSK